MIGIDLASRVGQQPNVLQLDATTFPYSPKLWPVICRPSHDGWCYDTIAHARRCGASTLYVGLEKNVEQDLAEFRSLRSVKKYANVGKDGEHMWRIPSVRRRRS